MAVKLTLDLPALERLIGGDTEIEFELRNGIASTFAEKYLKQVISSETIKELEFRLKAFTKTEISSYVAKEDSWKRACEIPGSLKELIKKEVDNNIKNVIQQEYTAHIDRVKEETAYYARQTDKWLEKVTQEYIHAEVKKKFESALGLVK